MSDRLIPRRGSRRILPIPGLLLLLLLIACAQTAGARTVVDMAGRPVQVPDTIRKIYAASPTALYLLYALDPDFIAGLNFPFNDLEKPYLRKDIVDLPELGGWFGQGRQPNLENVLQTKPDVMLVWRWKEAATNELIEKTARTLNLPLLSLRCETLEDYADSFEFMGELLDRRERARQLADYTRQTLAEIKPIVDAIPESERVSVYYAQGPDGLRTECSASTHAMLIPMAGGRNVHQCQAQSDFGMIKVSIEQVMAEAPEVILVFDRDCYDRIRTLPQWQHIKAVQDKRVVYIPRAPFSWFDRPPSFMRILGLRWLTHLLYPERFTTDIHAEAQNFYKLFLQLDLSAEQINTILVDQ